MAHLEYTLSKMIEAKDILAKLETAVKKGIIPKKLNMNAKIENALAAKLIKKAEAELLQTFEEARTTALRVDEFSEAQLRGK